MHRLAFGHTTGVHSSRMRTARSNGHLYGEGVSAGGCVSGGRGLVQGCVSRGLHPLPNCMLAYTHPAQLHAGIHTPPMDRMNDTRPVKTLPSRESD